MLFRGTTKLLSERMVFPSKVDCDVTGLQERRHEISVLLQVIVNKLSSPHQVWFHWNYLLKNTELVETLIKLLFFSVLKIKKKLFFLSLL